MGNVLDSVTPGVKFGGEVTRAVQISRISGCSAEEAAGIVAIQKLFSLSALFIVVTVFVGQVLFLPLVLVFLCIFFMPEKIEGLVLSRKESKFAWVRKLRGFLLTALAQVKNVRKYKSAWVPLALLTLFTWTLYPAKMYILTLQFEADFAGIAAITFAAYMVGMLPIFPGGLGGFEGTMSGLLYATGFAAADAAVITVFFRFTTFWFVMLLAMGYIASYKKVLPTFRER
jgi:uncharacterized protein (TIRG00374 family)